MNKDRFDLEQSILKCWNITEDIQVIVDEFKSMTEEEVLNSLNGVKNLYELKFSRLWNIFEAIIHQGDFTNGVIQRNEMINSINDMELNDNTYTDIYTNDYKQGYQHGKMQAIAVISNFGE